MMNWKKVVKQMKARGLSQSEIARRAGISSSAVSRLLSGSRTDPYWSIGDALLKVHSAVMRSARKGSHRSRAST